MHLKRFFRGGWRARAAELRGLGPLEHEVMGALWALGEASVREAHAHVGGGVAYTTVMTTLDRLYKKGLATRRLEGRAFRYAAAATAEELDRAVARQVVDGLLQTQQTTPLLSNLVDAVSERDRRLLDELERLVRDKRRALQRRGKP
jgi:predicted transcriptional regulator